MNVHSAVSVDPAYDAHMAQLLADEAAHPDSPPEARDILRALAAIYAARGAGHTPPATPAVNPHTTRLLAEAAGYPPGSPDRTYRERAAWKIDQMHRGVPSVEWTDTPPADFLNPQTRIAA